MGVWAGGWGQLGCADWFLGGRAQDGVNYVNICICSLNLKIQRPNNTKWTAFLFSNAEDVSDACIGVNLNTG